MQHWFFCHYNIIHYSEKLYMTICKARNGTKLTWSNDEWTFLFLWLRISISLKTIIMCNNISFTVLFFKKTIPILQSQNEGLAHLQNVSKETNKFEAEACSTRNLFWVPSITRKQEKKIQKASFFSRTQTCSSSFPCQKH